MEVICASISASVRIVIRWSNQETPTARRDAAGLGRHVNAAPIAAPIPALRPETLDEKSLAAREAKLSPLENEAVLAVILTWRLPIIEELDAIYQHSWVTVSGGRCTIVEIGRAHV